MYNDYFGLREAPFSIAPNPQYLFMSPRHREALAHLLYGIQSDGGFILLSGEVGTGKTTVCRCLLEQIPQDVDTAYILNPKLTAQELLATACDELKIAYPDGASIKVLVDCLNAFLLESHQDGRRTVLIIDEAQNLSVDVLEQLRLLTNLETNQRKLLQIILLGQPELLTLLAKQELRQLSQRVTARFHLDALNKEEVGDYIQHRLDIAGAKGSLFPQPAVNRVYQISKGIPRLINLVCDRALLGTYVQNKLQVDTATINNAAKEILGDQPKNNTLALRLGAAALVVMAVLGFAFVYQSGSQTDSPSTANTFDTAPAVTGTDTPDSMLTTNLETSSDNSNVIGSENAEINSAIAGIEAPSNDADNLTYISPDPEVLEMIQDQSLASGETPALEVDVIEGSAIGPSTAEASTIGFSSTDSQTTDSQTTASDNELNQLALLTDASFTLPEPTSLDSVTGHVSRSAAFESLMALWGAEVAIGESSDPCEVSKRSGLQCLTKLGSLRDVAHLNRPIVLNLPYQQNNQWHTVSSLNDKTVSLINPNSAKNADEPDVFTLSHEQVLEVWSGYYTLLWRTPPGHSQPAKKGDRGADIDWLRAQLSSIEGRDSVSVVYGAVFDASLEARVKRFQISVGLVPDGIVGAQTWIHLNSADASDIPKLGL